MAVNCAFFLYLTFSFLASTFALHCFLCGQYNDGVGSITPCINYTHMQLKECPLKEQAYCIKYISEGSLVKDCVAHCTERGLFKKTSNLFISIITISLSKIVQLLKLGCAIIERAP
ncbi:hypothetical protein RI129_005847 [Pyrocoelia pectoralis]|uniref:Uncharacterized protein n=1 Tax=Pyrocoelia pectoralis TaxID=417401 RepID=A0AAN7VBF4_9COLE